MTGCNSSYIRALWGTDGDVVPMRLEIGIADNIMNLNDSILRILRILRIEKSTVICDIMVSRLRLKV